MSHPDLAVPIAPSAAAIKKHERFYYADGTVVFHVEDTLYRVYRGPFQRNSSVFDTMFSLPQGGDASPEGLSDDRPIRLGDITCHDFDALVAVVCPAELIHDESHSLEEWKSVLTLAHKFEFDALQGIAIRHLATTMSDVEKIVCGKKYDITDWLLPAYVAVCTRMAPLSLEEIRNLSAEDVFGIVSVRETMASYYLAIAKIADGKGPGAYGRRYMKHTNDAGRNEVELPKIGSLLVHYFGFSSDIGSELDSHGNSIVISLTQFV